MVVNHLYRFINRAALRLGDFGLVIRVTHIQVSVGDEEEVPFLGGIERHGEAPRVAPQADRYLTLRTSGEFRHGELRHLLTEVPTGIELGRIFRLAQR